MIRIYSRDGVFHAEDGRRISDEEYARAAAAGLVLWIDPPASDPLDAARARLREAVNELRERAKGAGIEWRGRRWDTDARSRENLSAMVMALGAGVPLPPGFTWRSEANEDVPMTGPELVELASAVLAHGHACYRVSWALKSRIEGAEDPTAVDLYDGWPAQLRPPVTAPLQPLPPPCEALKK